VRQIAINSGEDGSVVVRKILDKEQYNYGFDAQNGEYGNLMTKGIIDPTKVVRAALQGAASVAGFVVVGSTVEEARAKRAKLDSLVDYANAIASLSITHSVTTRQNLIPTRRCRTISPKATLRRVAVSGRSISPGKRI